MVFVGKISNGIHHRTGDFGPNGPIKPIEILSFNFELVLVLGLCYGGVVY